MNSKIINFFFLIILGISLTATVSAEEKVKDGNSNFNKVNGSPSRTFLNINNISTQMVNDGDSDLKADGNSGFIFPKGSGKAAVFESGFLWGAFIGDDPQVRVGGSAYRHGIQPGKILPDGSPEDPNLPKNRIYRVRPDVFPGGPFVDLANDAIDEGSSVTSIRDQYELDWTEWPATDGAPYDDVDNDGTYNPTVDIPGVPGADQTVWFVANDLDPTITTFLYGAQPLGIEMQATYWAYAQTGALGNMYFRGYKIINKSENEFKDMIVSMWSDVDLGNSSDDFAGCDTLLSLGYCYNGNATDATYSPLPPPAVGFDFFQGPAVDAVIGQDLNRNGVDDGDPTEFAIFEGDSVYGKVNLPMTAFYYFARGDASVDDPTQGDPEGSTQFYNFFQGRVGKTGNPFVDPNTGIPTKYVLSGDPVAKTGWYDGQVLPAGDRRIGQASGPFTMAVGDTQEVVVAQIAAGAIPGVDRLSAIGLLKFYDKAAQVAYDNFFDLPIPPPAPEVTVIEADGEIILDWSKNMDAVTKTETFDFKQHQFQGYNVYQLPSRTADITQARRIATYDLNDGTGKIIDDVFDTQTGSVIKKPVQFGNDSGIKRFISVKDDVFNGGTPLINGIRYYFAVTAYSFNTSLTAVPNNLENPLSVFTVVPNDENPGVTVPTDYGDVEEATQGSGLADATITFKVVDPIALTGDSYEVYFSEVSYFRDPNAVWQRASTGINKVGDLTGSTIDATGVYGVASGTIELNFHLNNESPNGAWIDGVILTIPAGVTIVDAPAFEAGGGTVTPDVQGQVINMGLINDEFTQNGIFHGGEDWTVIVQGFSPPISINYLLKDDGYEGAQVDVSGSVAVNAIGTVETTHQYWNLKNTSTGQDLLVEQSIFGGIDVYTEDPANNIWLIAPGVYGPGGSAKNLGRNAGDDAVPATEGMQVAVDGSFEAPTTVNYLQLNGDPLSWNSGAEKYNFVDFTLFGYADATAATTLPLYGGAGGTTSLEMLQQDYELRFTGTTEVKNENGKDVVVTTSGGSMATIFGASGYSLADHPLNPNFGTEQRFAMPIPFEVWNTTTNQQINVVMWDRAGDIAVDTFYAWNESNRVYFWAVNTPYAPDVLDETSTSVAENATWNWVLYQTDFTKDDVIEVNYANPIQIGLDKFQFTTQESSYSKEDAAEDVKKINVFPNPYYAVNSEEINKYNRFVTFNHLPEKATIRIFNLAGIHVKTINKENTSQFERWDLANTSGLPVASGLYIAYIEMPDVGETKILKFSVIQEQQILDRF
ncbi:MAG: T9SS type A sorting domain-containing protein [Ignavibacteriae bacterium]|jgi:hypothetical protein|nr:T9SS C-terminal target domain-containing protein [Ignavibacteriota bacterium]NOG99927.1 T9SS type A sorting domain-containing protein [Ignavibacteriota bacterium]